MKINDISIIIPTRNRYEQLIRLLKSINIALNNYNNPNIIIVDDGSTDQTRELDSIDDMNVKVVHILRGGPARARNIGANLVTTDIILFTDDDCIFPSNYFDKLEGYIKKPDWDILGGQLTFWPNGKCRNNAVSLFLKKIGHLEGPYCDENGDIKCLPSGHLLIKMNTLKLINGFDTEFKYAGGEDNNLTIKAIRSGAVIINANELIIYHEHPKTVTELIKKYFIYGYGNQLNCQKLKLDRKISGFKCNKYTEIIKLIIKKNGYYEINRPKKEIELRKREQLYYKFIQIAYETGGLVSKSKRKKVLMNS